VSESTADRILEVLASVAETEEVRSNPDLALYDLQVLDSMKTVQLIVELGREIGVEVSPASSTGTRGLRRASWSKTCSGGWQPEERAGEGEALDDHHPQVRLVGLTLYYLAVSSLWSSCTGAAIFRLRLSSTRTSKQACICWSESTTGVAPRRIDRHT
jgi:D-alanine--poly(phosphoribitol) ligase subunit 2